MTLRWKVSHNSEYGQPGPLAYKLDTLVVNRKLEEAGRPVPRIIRLGGLKEIARELGLSTHDTRIIKHALYQNASAFITAKIRYKSRNEAERSIEIGDTRYAVVFTGERLPDGRTADAVYLVLHDFYREVLDDVVLRPLDFDYLKGLPPVSQRWYELASFAIYAAHNHALRVARLSYAKFCSYAPQVRYPDFDRVKKQMHKVHAPHRRSGYIADVEFEATSDREGRPDWTLIYAPGPKAKAEYRAFTKKGGLAVLAVEPVAPEPGPEPTGLERELIDRGVTASKARELVRDFPEDRIMAQVANLDGRRRKVKDPGAWLTSAIKQNFAPKAEPQAVKAEPVAVAVADQAGRQRAQTVRAFWEGLTVEERERIDAEALAQADPTLRAEIEGERRPSMRRLRMSAVRDEYLKSLLNVPVVG
jgi:hypothetical protein